MHLRVEGVVVPGGGADARCAPHHHNILELAVHERGVGLERAGEVRERPQAQLSRFQ